MSNLFRVFAGSILLMFITISCNRTEYSLLYKPEPGDTCKHTISLDIVAKQTFEGQELITGKQMIFTVESRVKDVKDSIATIECCYTYISIDDDMGTSKLNFNSEDTTAVATINNLSSLLCISKNKPFSIEVNQQGVIENIEGFEPIKKQMGSIIEDEDVKNYIIQYVENQIGNEALKTYFEYFTAIFPNKPVKAGSSWNIINANSSGNFKLKKVKAGIAHIECDLTIYSQNPSRLFNLGGLSISPDLQGTQTGLLYIDVLTGKPIEGEVTKVLNGSITVKQANNSLNIPLSAEIKVKLSSQS